METPFTGDVDEVQVMAREAKKVNVYGDDFIFDCAYVHERVDDYGSEKASLTASYPRERSSKKSSKRMAKVSLTSRTQSKTKSLTVRITEEQMNLQHKIFTDDEDATLSFYIADVKYFPLYNDICCFCVPYNGDIDESRILVEEAMVANEYDDACIFDCDYVMGRVALYRSTL